MKGKKKLKKLVKYAKKIGYDVEFKRNCESQVIFEKKKIFITTKLKQENQLYVLLHELGHVAVRKPKATFKKKYLYHKMAGRSKEYLVTELEEEIQAWREAREIVKQAEITIDGKEFEKYAAKSIFSYIEYAADKFSWKDVT